MNSITHNFWLVIESWKAQLRLHCINRKTRKAIRKHGKELAEAKRQADLMHKATGKSYYVLPDHEGSLRVLDKAGIKNLKRFKVMDKAVTVVDLLTESEYNTMNNHFVVLCRDIDKYGHESDNEWYYCRGTILECIEEYERMGWNYMEILGGFERIVSIKDGKIIKH